MFFSKGNLPGEPLFFDPHLYGQSPELLARINPHLERLHYAARRFDRPQNFARTKNNQFQQAYTKLYYDIRENERLWFHRIFPITTHYIERCIAILGTLVMVVRETDGGDEKMCKAVLRLTLRLVNHHKQNSSIIAQRGDTATPPNLDSIRLLCHDLTHKMNIIAINTHTKYGQREKAVALLREAALFELDHDSCCGIHKDWTRFVSVLDFFVPLGFLPQSLNPEVIAVIEDNKIWNVLQTFRNELFNGPFEVDMAHRYFVKS